LPTWPDEFASPSGNFEEAEFRSSRGLSMEFPATATILAFCRCSFPSLSAYTTPVTLPASSCSMRSTWLFGRTSNLPVASPLGIST
jgi:hypothetical protein